MGKKLVRRKGVVLAALAVAASCNRSIETKIAPAAPQQQVTVVTLHTETEPARKAFDHLLFISGNTARTNEDVDRWRLFDTSAQTVTFVDDIAKSYRVESLQALLARRAKVTEGRLPPGIPQATIAPGTTPRTIAGIAATESVIRCGAYMRQLWIGRHPAIPDTLFSLMEASEVPESRFAPMMKSVDDALLGMRGFPLAEHSELPYLDGKFVVDRVATKVETRNVPQTFLRVPAGYKRLEPLYAEPVKATPPAK